MFLIVFNSFVFATEEVDFLSGQGFFEDTKKNFTAENDIVSSENMDFRGFAIKFFLVTCIIIVAVIIIWFSIKKNSAVFKGQNMQLLETLSLGNGRAIALVYMTRKILVIGITSQNIRLIEKIEDAETVEEIRDNVSENRSSFKEILMMSSLKSFDDSGKNK